MHQQLPSSSDDMPRPPTRRKRKRNSERTRVTRACDRCKQRKIKCNGTQPCEYCSRASVSCTFDSAYARGRVPVIPTAPPDAVGSERRTSMPAIEDSVALNISPSVSRQQPDWAEPPESSQTDLDGHYVGPASGVSFLLRIQKRLHQAISFSQPSSIFTFGDAPLHPPQFDPSFCMMLTREDAQRLVDRYFDFAMPTYRFLHRPTIQKWFVEFYDTLGLMRNARSAPSKIALLFMVFAQGRVYMPDEERPGPPDLSVRYYLAAEHHLTKETGAIRLTSVQARLTQCYYLLTQSRINHCWSLFGTVSHLALALGLNRNRNPNAASGLTQVEVECRRRTFWCAYTLDAHLSAALGRPRSFHDEDIDTQLPACVDDHELSPIPDQLGPPALDPGSSVMLAPIAHIKLARIISKVLRQLYSIKPISAGRRAAFIKTISRELSDWRLDLGKFLDTDTFSASLLIPIFQRQRNVLNLTYWHTIILTYRPFVLSNFADLSPQDRRTDSEIASSQFHKGSVIKCLMAAMETVKTVDEITRNRQMFRAFWITAYFAFSATALLYVYVIQNRDSSPDLYSNYLKAATQCQTQLSGIAERGSLSERYCLVLEELRLEVVRQVNNRHDTYIRPGEMDVSLREQGPQTAISFLEGEEISLETVTSHTGSVGGETGQNAMMHDVRVFGVAADAAGYGGWDDFFSIVSSGLCDVDVSSLGIPSTSDHDYQRPSFS